ncbi:MAG: hypothetical protein U0271_03960 [Polyangiaceae bacterium]
MTKRIAGMAAVLTLGLGLFVAGGSSVYAGEKGGAKKPDKPAATSDAPATQKPITVQPKDLAWGIDKKKLGAIYDKVIEKDYAARYKRTQPGPSLDALDAEVNEKKNEFRRNIVDFNDVATGWDSTPLRSEYTYNNKESMMWIDRAGKTRYFFFINDKLWKVIDAIKLGEKSLWGKTFEDALGPFKKTYGVDGRSRAADVAQGRPFPEFDWKDSTTQVRAVDWGNDQFAIAFQESATVSQLASLRKNKDTTQVSGVDAKVKDVGRGPDPDPTPKKEEPKKKGK